MTCKTETPAVKFDAVIKFDKKELQKICKHVSEYAKYIWIECTDKSVIFLCKVGDLIQQITCVSGINNVDINFAKDVPEIIKGKFELNGLLSMLGQDFGICRDFQIYIKNEQLMCIKFTAETVGKIIMCFKSCT